MLENSQFKYTWWNAGAKITAISKYFWYTIAKFMNALSVKNVQLKTRGKQVIMSKKNITPATHLQDFNKQFENSSVMTTNIEQ